MYVTLYKFLCVKGLLFEKYKHIMVFIHVLPYWTICGFVVFRSVVIHIETYRSVMQRDALFKLMKPFTESQRFSDSLENIKVKIRFIQCKHSKEEQTYF